MNSDKTAAIERLRELHEKSFDAFESDLEEGEEDSDEEELTSLLKKAEAYGIQKLFDEAMPIIDALQAENKQLKDAIAQAEQFIGLIESHGLEYALSKVVKA